jgi:hypothetical protein
LARKSKTKANYFMFRNLGDGDDPKDQSRGMAPSETMKKVSAINPMGLLGDTSDNDQEMREVEDSGATADADPAMHKNVHVISASEGEGSECGMQGDGSEPDNNNATAVDTTAANKEKSFIIVSIERPATQPVLPTSAEPGDSLPPQSASTLMPPPSARAPPAATATASTAAPVPDPATVKRIFQRIGEGGSQHSAIQPPKNSGQGKTIYENQNEKTDSGSSKNSETSRSETVLPKIKLTAVEADLVPPKTYKAIVANKKKQREGGHHWWHHLQPGPN